MKKFIITVVICSIAFISNAQTKQTDSLQNLLARTDNPLKRFDIINNYLLFTNTTYAANLDSASCLQLLKIAQDLKNDSLLAISYNMIGSYFATTTGDNVTALEYYFKAIPLAEKAKDKRRISSLYFDIAQVYSTLQNRNEEFKNIIKGGENLPEPSSTMYNFMKIQFQRGLCGYYLETNRPDSALNYAQLFTETLSRVGTSNFRFSALFFSATAYAQTGDEEMAELYFKRAKEMSASIQLNSLLSAYYSYYIEFLLDKRRIDEAKTLSEQCFTLGKENNNNPMKLRGAAFLRRVYDASHQNDSAYYYSRMEADINKLIFNQNNINKMQALAFNETIRIVEENAKKKTNEEQRKQNIQFALIASGIITFIIFFLLFSRSIVANEGLISFFGVLGLLVVFEFINLLIHPWLASFTHESPVLMLLALVIIASALIPLHHRLEKWIKEKMTEKNKAIRLAAAKKTIATLEGELNVKDK